MLGIFLFHGLLKIIDRLSDIAPFALPTFTNSFRDLSGRVNKRIGLVNDLDLSLRLYFEGNFSGLDIFLDFPSKLLGVS